MAVYAGTNGDDTYQGSADADQIDGKAGNDMLMGGGGGDQIWGGDGIDLMFGDAGDDYIYAGGPDESDEYKDYLYGGAGFDRLYGGVGDEFDGGDNSPGIGDYAYINLSKLTQSVIFDMTAGNIVPITGGGLMMNVEQIDLWSGSASDRLKAGAAADTIHAGNGNDAVYGGDGADFLYGQAGNDVLRGEAGEDNLRGDIGHDRLIGGAGRDTLYGDQEGPLATDGNDQLNGGAEADILYGGGGSDVLIGGTGDDQLWGGTGSDIFAFSGGGQGNDRVRDFSAAEGDRFDLDGKSFTAVASDGAGGSMLTWDGGTIRVDGVTGLSLAEWNALIVKGGNSLVRLTDAYDNILRYSPASDENRAYLKDLNDKVVSGALTEANAVKAIINLADASAAVATVSYAFFTGKTPGEGGMDYLLSPIGPNPNNLNSDYYKGFNAENRYINFAVNLGRDGDGKTAFAAEYGNKTLFEATRTAYAKIFGKTPDDAKVHDLIDTRADYFKAYGQTDLGTKAAMVGWLLAEAMKADVGQFAGASNAYFTDMADGGPFNVDLIGQYGKPEYNL